MPSSATSSRRPTKGEMKVAPALAASSACTAEKHKVTLTMVPSSRSALQVFSPSIVIGTLTATFFAILARRRPSANWVAWSLAVTSALTGPGTMPQISRIASLKSRPDFAISDGLVVTPSTRPVAARSRISAMSAVSTKNFMLRFLSPHLLHARRQRGGPSPFGLRDYRMPTSHASSAGDSIAAASGARVRVLLPLPLAGAYDYAVPAGFDLAPGDFVSVPLGARKLAGVVWGPSTDEIASEKVKPVAARLDAPPLSAELRALIDWVAAYTLAPPGAVLRMAMSVPDALEPAHALT